MHAPLKNIIFPGYVPGFSF